MLIASKSAILCGKGLAEGLRWLATRAKHTAKARGFARTALGDFCGEREEPHRQAELEIFPTVCDSLGARARVSSVLPSEGTKDGLARRATRRDGLRCPGRHRCASRSPSVRRRVELFDDQSGLDARGAARDVVHAVGRGGRLRGTTLLDALSDWLSISSYCSVVHCATTIWHCAARRGTWEVVCTDWGDAFWRLYQVSVPRVVAGTYFEISVQSRGKEWTVQKKITQFEELHKELCELFTRELEGVAAFPQPGMFQSREVRDLRRTPSPRQLSSHEITSAVCSAGPGAARVAPTQCRRVPDHLCALRYGVRDRATAALPWDYGAHPGGGRRERAT